MKGRLFIAVSLLASSVSCAFAVDLPATVAPPSIQAGSWVLMDYTTGQVLTAGNEHQQRNPASLTKLMTGYVVDRAIDSHRITFDDIVTVGKDAWAKGNPVFDGSSLMFLKPGDRVSVRDLSRGLIVDSGNDACVALATCGTPISKPSTASTPRASTVRPMTSRCSRGRLFMANLTSTTCTARKA